MKKILSILFLVCSLTICERSEAAGNVNVSTVSGPLPFGMVSNYSDLQTALNAFKTLGGTSTLPETITFTMLSPLETIPAGGWVVNFNVVTSSTAQVILDGGGFDFYSSTALTSGSLTDALFKVVGSDWVTIRFFGLHEDPANTNTTPATNNMTEWGIAFLEDYSGVTGFSGTTGGAQNNTVFSDDISLDQSYTNSFGIYSNVRHNATNPAGNLSISNATTDPNSGNTINFNKISKVNMGIFFDGSNTDANRDLGNHVTNNYIIFGSSSPALSTFRGSDFEYYGICFRSQKNDIISDNTIDTYTLNGTAAHVRAIHRMTQGTIAGSFTSTIDNNIINSVIDNLPYNATIYETEAIFCERSLGTGSVSVSGNTIRGMSMGSSNPNRIMRCISIDGLAIAGSFTVDRNIISSNSSSAFISTTSADAGIYFGGTCTTASISNNSISDFTCFGDANAILCINPTITTLTVRANKIHDMISSSQAANGIHFAGGSVSVTTCNIKNNIIGRIYGQKNSGTSRVSTTGIRLIAAAPSSTFNVFYNTVYLDASPTNGPAGTAAIYLNASTTSTTTNTVLRNNILVDLSTPGTSGVTAAVWRSLNTFANYGPNSDHNIYYAGSNFVLYQAIGAGGSGSSLLGYQALVTPQDAMSYNFLPILASVSSPGSADYLHLIDCAVYGLGDNSISPQVSDDFDGDPRLTVSPYTTDIGADEVTQFTTWVGTSGNWGTASNWSPAIVPNTSNTHVTIPSGGSPAITSTYSVGNLSLASGATLTNNGLLKIAGTVTAPNGSISNYDGSVPPAVVGSIELNGVCSAQTIGGLIFVNSKVFNFTASNTFATAPQVTISSVAGDGVKVVGELGFGSGVSNTVLNTGPSTSDNDENITLISTYDGTADVGKILGSNQIVGDVTVERYINTGLGITGPPNQHARAFEFMSTPTIGQTIRQSWMEGMVTGNDNRNPGYGTNIPGSNAANYVADGYDQAPINGPGIKSWNYATNSFIAPSNTAAALYEPKGYYLFVRGDRSVFNISGSNSDPVPTTLRQKGTLLQPNAGGTYVPPVMSWPSGLPTNRFIGMGNPYASAIDLNYMYSSGAFNNVGNTVCVYDPSLGSLGGLQYLDLPTGCTAGTMGGNTNYYTVTQQYPYVQSGNGFFVFPNATSSAGSVTFSESVKVTGQHHLVNRPAPASDRKWFNAILYFSDGHTVDGTSIFFDKKFTNQTDAYDAFKIPNFGENFMIKRGDQTYAIESRLPVESADSVFYTFSNLQPRAYQIKFTPMNMKGEMLTAVLLDNYLKTSTPISLDEANFINFTVDKNAASYENRFIVVFDKMFKNPVVMVEPGLNADASFSVYPNPVENKQLDIHFNNQPSGNYQVQLFNNAGQLVYGKTISIDGKHAASSIHLNKAVTAGNYRLCITGQDGKKMQQQVVIR